MSPALQHTYAPVPTHPRQHSHAHVPSSLSPFPWNNVTLPSIGMDSYQASQGTPFLQNRHTTLPQPETILLLLLRELRLISMGPDLDKSPATIHSPREACVGPKNQERPSPTPLSPALQACLPPAVPADSYKSQPAPTLLSP